MATMKDMFSTLLDKLERTTRKLALAEQERDRYEKLACEWERRALAAAKERDEAKGECVTWRSRYDKVVAERNPLLAIIEAGSVYTEPPAREA